MIRYRVSRITSVADDAARSAITVPFVCRLSSPPFLLLLLSLFLSVLPRRISSLSQRREYTPCSPPSRSLALAVSRSSSLRLRYAPETPRCISSIFKRHGPSAVGSASIYKASGAPVTLDRLPLATHTMPLWPRRGREATACYAPRIRYRIDSVSSRRFLPSRLSSSLARFHFSRDALSPPLSPRPPRILRI